MGKLNNDFTFTGSVGNLTAYKRWDSDKIILRQKGGPSKKKIKTSPSCQRVRENNVEFGGRATATRWIRKALWPQKELADYGFTAALNSLMMPIQKLDTVSKRGERSVCITKNPTLLNGFNLNRRAIFDSIIRHPVRFTVSKKSLSASLDIPALIPGISLFAPGRQVLYSLVAALGVLPDLNLACDRYLPNEGYGDSPYPAVAETSWYPVVSGSAGETMSLQFRTVLPDQSFCLILSIGIRFGTIAAGGAVEHAVRAGAAKILWVE